MNRLARLLAIIAVVAMAAVPATLAANADFQTIQRTVTLPADQTEVTLTVRAFSAMQILQISIDNTPTGRDGLCTADFSVVPPKCTSGDSAHEITAFKIGDSFYKTGNSPYDLGGSALAVRQVFGDPVLDDVKGIPVPRYTPFSITLRADSSSANDVRVEVIFGVIGGVGLSLAVTEGPVNP